MPILASCAIVALSGRRCRLAWGVHRVKVFGRCEVKSGIAPVDQLVREVMEQEPR